MTAPLSEATRARIAADQRPYNTIALSYGLTYHQVVYIKQRAAATGSKEQPNRGTVARQPLPQRHYRVDWDAEARS